MAQGSESSRSGAILTPRRYQEEIFLKAQQGNVIAALDTGSGKTLISAMLIKWVSAQEGLKKKVVIFLVPKVPLVEQQGGFIARHTALRVAQVHGDVSASVTDRTRWNDLFVQSDVLVTTGQIFLNVLTHSHWSMDKVSLLVFDECHHARKSHPYTSIMREYRACPEADRPKVFGMTAIPTWKSSAPETSLETLEMNLNSKIVTVQEHLDELALHSSKPTEVVREFPAPPQTYFEYPIPTIWSRFDWSQVPAAVEIPWQQLENRYSYTLATLGIFAAELYLYSDLQTRISEYLHPRDPDEMELLRLRYLYASISDEGTGPPIRSVPELQGLAEVLAEYQPFFDHIPSDEDASAPWSFSVDWCAPKVQTLIEILLESYTPAFHGIVFVERRHIARVLSSLISRVPVLRSIITCAECVGHGSEDKGIGGGMPTNRQRQTVNDFREGKVNLLIATPVAEEGLDFPACDVAVRFDAIHGMVGYVQSRGRTRHVSSNYVIMVQEKNTAEIDRYRSLSESEPHIKQLYQAGTVRLVPEVQDNDEGEESKADYVYPTDLAKRERYTVPSTGAVLTYNSAIALLEQLCSLIPCDAFMPAQKPRYSGDFVAAVRLPSMLPLPSEHLVYEGPHKHSKKEAKRAVAFKAVKALHGLGVFDDYLLPAHGKRNNLVDEDLDHADAVVKIPEMMDVVVRAPWTPGSRLWSHPVSMNGKRVAALITGTVLPSTSFVCEGTALALDEGQLVQFDVAMEDHQRKLLQDYTDLGLWWRVSARPRSTPLSCFLVPLVLTSSQPDFRAIEDILEKPHGSYDWAGVDESAYGHVLAMNNMHHGRPYLLQNIRHDLTPLSKPSDSDRGGGFPTFWEYFKWLLRKRKRGNVPEVPTQGPLIEVSYVPRQISRSYQLQPYDADVEIVPGGSVKLYLMPLASTRLFSMPEDMFTLFGLFPRLLHRIQDVWRAREARICLSLPPILDDRLIEATTLPAASAGFNNQRLETLGDSVLKLSTSVHLYNKYPHCHEGQLDSMRRRAISNRTLMLRAKAIGLEHYLNAEVQTVKVWPTVVAEDSPSLKDPTRTDRTAKQRMARRSLQDCMEATIAAGYLSGGITVALQVGTALGLNFGGPVPWTLRYAPLPYVQLAPERYSRLQDVLGYEFQHAELLQEALTHPSFWSGGKSYQRLEFLGDAVIDLAVMTYLFNKFPRANSGQLTSLRCRVVCGPVLAFVAVQILGLHEFILAEHEELASAVVKYASILRATSCHDIVMQSWAHDPPKVMSDVLESLVAAILIDSGYNFEKTICIVDAIMDCVLEVLYLDLPPDPVSAFFVWAAKAGCQRICLRKSCSRADLKQNDTVCVIVHDITVVGPVTASSLSVARAFASERARMVLQDAGSEKALGRICDCMQVQEDKPPGMESSHDENVDESTEPGFAAVARSTVAKFRDPQGDQEQPGADGGASGSEDLQENDEQGVTV
ncbi:hypothetical protein BC834DRAFT_973021 [Gloeopeniophorella convolvens]|nr:hypothetical protein BC834DRAFT_973021 [Gloeopeniophorella convolvens]